MLCHPFQRTYFYYSVLSLSSFVICLSPPFFFCKSFTAYGPAFGLSEPGLTRFPFARDLSLASPGPCCQLRLDSSLPAG